MTRRCIAPLNDGDALCGAPATTTRIVEGLDCALCAAHAAEIDHDHEEDIMATTIEHGGRSCERCGSAKSHQAPDGGYVCESLAACNARIARTGGDVGTASAPGTLTTIDRKRIGTAMGRIARRHGVSQWVSGESSRGWWAWGTTRDGAVLRIRVSRRVIIASIDGRKVSVEGLDDSKPPKW